MISTAGKNLLKWVSGRPLVYGSVLSFLGNGIGRIGGIVASIIIAAIYGANIHTDVFYLVFAVINFFFNFFQGTLELAFIPIYSEVSRKNNPEVARFLGSILLSILLVTAGIALFIDILVHYFAPFFLPGKTHDLVPLAIRLTWEMSPLIIGFGISTLFMALFNAERLFMTAGLIQLFPSLGIIIFVFLSKDTWGIHALPFGLLFGTLLQAYMIYLICKKRDFKLEWTIYNPYLRKILGMTYKQALALILFSTMPVIDRMIASLFLPVGNLTTIENASRLCQIPWAFANWGYINVFFSRWSKKSSEGDFVYVDASFRKLFVLSCVVFIPVSLILFMGSVPIVRTVFGYGEYSDPAVTATSEVFAYFCLGYWAYMLRSTLIRFYSSQQRLYIIVRAAVLDFCVHFLVIFLFIERMGVATIGIATTIGYFVSLGYVLVYYFKVKHASTITEYI